MSKKKQLSKLISNGRFLDNKGIDAENLPRYVIEWVVEVEAFLIDNSMMTTEFEALILETKLHRGRVDHWYTINALLKQMYKRKFEGITPPVVSAPKQVFIAMMFSELTKDIYENGIAKAIETLGYVPHRIDEKHFNGLIISEIIDDIASSPAMVVDLTGNRGGVYYEAGVARGLQCCNHPIEVVFICQEDYFDGGKGVHFDTRGYNVLCYKDTEDLKCRLEERLRVTLCQN